MLWSKTHVNKRMSQRPTQAREMNGQTDVEVDYKRKYKNLKRKLKFLVYEQECFQEELRRAQRKLLKVSRDKSFLLDRLLQYERVDEDSSDSDATVSSENSEGEGLREREREREIAKKRKSSPGACLSSSSSSPHLSLLSRSGVNPLQSSSAGSYLNAMPFPPEYLAPPAERMKKERKTKTPKNKRVATGKVVGPMAANYTSASGTPQTASSPFSWVPKQMLSGDAADEEGESDGDSDKGDEDRGEGDEAELVIDIPNE
ncbi:INO80 complex subunit E isoform X1 [Gambusia affinis]|uniref:INO80 complex subunit E isoform X1 n=2 Tax=Gambusia affinis TaxID=33528 RepID=UPI001CDB4CC1|nr:INO80 complex subunit E isoform X1 [Gambusia affinis]